MRFGPTKYRQANIIEASRGCSSNKPTILSSCSAVQISSASICIRTHGSLIPASAKLHISVLLAQNSRNQCSTRLSRIEQRYSFVPSLLHLGSCALHQEVSAVFPAAPSTTIHCQGVVNC